MSEKTNRGVISVSYLPKESIDVFGQHFFNLLVLKNAVKLDVKEKDFSPEAMSTVSPAREYISRGELTGGSVKISPSTLKELQRMDMSEVSNWFYENTYAPMISNHQRGLWMFDTLLWKFESSNLFDGSLYVTWKRIK